MQKFYGMIFDLLVFLVGLYMLYSGFTGKGSLFKNGNIKKGFEEKYRKLIKWFCLVGGIAAVLLGALDYFKIQPLANILFIVLCVIVVCAIAVIASFTKPRT